jgi:hypothetical protein
MALPQLPSPALVPQRTPHKIERVCAVHKYTHGDYKCVENLAPLLVP